ANQVIVGGGVARGWSGLLADGARHQICGNRGTGATARAAGAAAGIVGIAGGAAEAAAVARGVFTHVRFGEDDRTGLTQSRNDLRITWRTVIGIVRRCAAGGAHVESVELILDGEDDPVHRSFQFSGARE